MRILIVTLSAAVMLLSITPQVGAAKSQLLRSRPDATPKPVGMISPLG
jgi:hypothetical protein